MGELWRTAVCGTAFGAALAYSGVFLPEVILAQMRLESFHMLQVFLTATASSALVLCLPGTSSNPNICARKPHPLRYLGSYGGNILGGLLIGFGMTLAGACPGTVFVQVGTGVKSGLLVLGGTALGGVAHQALAGYFTTPDGSSTSAPHTRSCSRSTVSEALGLRKGYAVAGYIALCSGVICCSSRFEAAPSTPQPALPSPIGGGLLIGGVQALSVLLRGKALGVSGVFSDTGRWFCDFLDGHVVHRPLAHPQHQRKERYPTDTQMFASGLMLGSLALSLSALGAEVPPAESNISTLRALAGGFCLAFGALMGGGCTSGHGISGMAMLGISSVVSVASMFAGGMALAVFV